jgi:hypothetical protein
MKKRLRKSEARRGIYRLELPTLGECARVSYAAGDAYPYLEKQMYEALGFWPDFDELPVQSETDRRHIRQFWSSSAPAASARHASAMSAPSSMAAD